MNLDYAITDVSARELLAIFGSAKAAIRGTGDNVAKACFFRANQELAAKACKVKCERGPLLRDLLELREDERVRESQEKAAAKLAEKERKEAAIKARIDAAFARSEHVSIAGIAREVGASNRAVSGIYRDMRDQRARARE